MDFLEYGIKNENSRCILRRLAAQLVLILERKKADFCESRLNQKQLSLPDDPEEDAALLQRIWEQIERETIIQDPDMFPDERNREC